MPKRRPRRLRLNRLDLTIGGAIILVLFTALVGPLLVDWTAYRDTFESEATKILGHQVRVEGTAQARLLPMPTLTFTDVTVGEGEAEPMATVKRFTLRIELLPLLRGKFLVNELILERPEIHLEADNAGQINWLGGGGAVVDPERVEIQKMEIRRGTIDFHDVRTGATLALTEITTNKVDARSLYGPWRIDGSVNVNGIKTPFTVATGRKLDSGAFPVSAEFSPQESVFFGRLLTDGVIRSTNAGVTYNGKYQYEKFDAATAGGSVNVAPVISLHSDGKFDLTPQRLRITDFALARGQGGDLSDVTGAVTVAFGAKPRFDAVVSARQINLDAQAGKGPEGKADVAGSARQFISMVTGLPVSPMPGRVGIDIPAVVVGGSLIQNLRLDAVAKDNTWSIEGLSVELPGRTKVTADGIITPGEKFGIVADTHVSSELPAALASWWQGNGEARPIAAFDFGAGVKISPDAVDAENIVAQMGGATARGAAHWARTEAGGRSSVDLAADRIDLVSLLGIAELVGGGQLPSMTTLPTEFGLRLTADKVTARQATLEDVAIDLSREADKVTVNRLSVGNLAGAKLETQSGQITGIDGDPNGRLETVLTAENLDGLSLLAATIAPDSGFTKWMRRADQELAPVALTATLLAPGENGNDYTLALNGKLGKTDVASSFSLAGKLGQWRTGKVTAAADFSSEDAAALGRQAGLDLIPVEKSGSGKFSARIEGVPDSGAEAKFSGELAGLGFNVGGKLTMPAAGGTRFDGRVDANSSDLEPLLLLFGRPPALEGAGAFALAGTLKTEGAQATLAIDSASVGGQAASGQLELAPEATGWKIGGQITVDAVDLAWLGSVALGVEPAPTGQAGAAWPETPFTRPAFGALDGTINVTAAKFAAGRLFNVDNARLELTLHPDLLGVDLKSGTVAGGTMVGEVQVRNPTGDAAVTGHFAIRGGDLSAMVWNVEGKPVASGHFDVLANFEATGRSVAGLVGSLGGDGTFAIHDGEVRYANLGAFDKVLQQSEAGKVFNGDQLRDAFRASFDESALAFQKADGAFRMTAGKMRAMNIKLDAGDNDAGGDATLDVNSLTIDSSWKIATSRPDERVSGAVPQVQVVFSGPLMSPSRQIDVSQFAEYLTLRALQREQVLHDKLVAERRERELAVARKAAGAAIALRAAREGALRWLETGTAARRAWEQAELERRQAEEEEAARKAREADAIRAAQERIKAEAENRPVGSTTPPLPLNLQP